MNRNYLICDDCGNEVTEDVRVYTARGDRETPSVTWYECPVCDSTGVTPWTTAECLEGLYELARSYVLQHIPMGVEGYKSSISGSEDVEAIRLEHMFRIVEDSI